MMRRDDPILGRCSRSYRFGPEAGDEGDGDEGADEDEEDDEASGGPSCDGHGGWDSGRDERMSCSGDFRRQRGYRGIPEDVKEESTTRIEVSRTFAVGDFFDVRGRGINQLSGGASSLRNIRGRARTTLAALRSGKLQHCKLQLWNVQHVSLVQGKRIRYSSHAIEDP